MRNFFNMLLNSKKLIGLKVETKSGDKLGAVRSFDLDADTLEIKTIYARPKSIAKELVSGDLIISRNLIISVDENKVTVDDLLARELARGKAGQQVAAKSSPMVALTREDC
jgi:sporulation protein YlmC with PRC-barrel domain